ncbi:MAG: hypothetical protein IJD62_05635 [Oscillospiraceae bacterium]|nr:hypothetical protein [Oscillospiraceae bacterium]
MKKALALVLALVLALSMAVSAFALTLDVIELVKDTAAGTELIKLEKLPALDGEYKVSFVVSEGGVYHLVIDNAGDYKDLAVSSTGIVAAELIDWDPEVYASIGETYAVINEKGEAVATGLSYDEAKAEAKAKNDAAKVTYHKVVCEQEIVIVELVVSENYSASYKEGAIKVTGVEKATGKKVSGSWDVIADVTIFEYEEVKYAAANKVALVAEKGTGYSDYKTAVNGYGEKYNPSDLRAEGFATVVSTTAFRAIEGKDLIVAADANNYVTIYDVAAGQKGVNFELYGYDEIIENKEFVGFEFGFFGDQVVKSAFEITLQPGVTYYELREAFGVKVEEDDIVDFYLLKDGKVAQIITVDFMTVDLAEKVEITVKGENTTLGQYELRLAAPVAAEGEENPNTGAESVVGVVAALAVVSVATAAAVSLKK